MLNLIRQLDLVNSRILSTPICVIGCGGIGSFLILTLSKMGFTNISCYDEDYISSENIPNQFYQIDHIGLRKSVALSSLVNRFTEIKIHYDIHMFDHTSKVKKGSIIISAVDSLKVRAELYSYYLKHKKTLGLRGFLDGRMGRHQAEVYVVHSPKDEAYYAKSLNKKPAMLRCTEKAVIYNVLYIASIICSQLKLLLEGKFYKRSIITDLENMDMVTTNGGG